MSAIAEAWKRKDQPAAAPRAPGANELRRMLSRQTRQLRSPFEGAEQNRYLEDWLVGAYDPRDLINRYLSILRQRSRDLARHSPQFISAIKIIVDNVVGQGFRVKPMPYTDEVGDEPDTELATQLARLWDDWSCEADVDRRESLAMLFRTAAQELVETGEVLLVEKTPRRDDGRVVPLIIEVIPGERLDHTFEREQKPSDATDAGNAIVHGIEFNRDGQRVAYWITRLNSLRAKSMDRERVPADRVHHVFARLRSGQERGLPWLAGAVALCHDLDDLIDTELTSSQVAACLTAFITSAQGGMFGPDQERDKEDDRPISRLAPGMVGHLKPGEAIHTVDPDRPSGSFDPFASFLTRCLARTMGISYESVSGDWRQVNFASGRLGHLVERKTFRGIQDLVIQLAVRPIYRSFVRYAVLAKRVSISLIDYVANWRRHTHAVLNGPGWEHHDPLKEVTAAALRVLSCLSTLDEEAAALGRDWADNVAQRAREIQRMKDLGVPIINIGGAQSVTGQGDGTKPIEPEQGPAVGIPRSRLTFGELVEVN
jgi:lambda family phage portal protein